MLMELHFYNDVGAGSSPALGAIGATVAQSGEHVRRFIDLVVTN